MKRLNARYRGVDKSTDVLSFPLSVGRLAAIGKKRSNTPFPLGDIVICVPIALLQAKEYGISFHEETQRLLVHGLLHLAGYDHELNAYQKRKMVKKEGELLDALTAMA
jgi:probable rRNA maturation factor